MVKRAEGDTGRLHFIKESIEKGKPLYKSDRNYLESKLDWYYKTKKIKDSDADPKPPKIDNSRFYQNPTSHSRRYSQTIEKRERVLSEQEIYLLEAEIIRKKEHLKEIKKEQQRVLEQKKSVEGVLSGKLVQLEKTDERYNALMNQILEKQHVYEELEQQEHHLERTRQEQTLLEDKILDEKYNLARLEMEQKKQAEKRREFDESIKRKYQEIEQAKKEHQVVLEQIDQNKGSFDRIKRIQDEMARIHKEWESIQTQIKHEKETLTILSEERQKKFAEYGGLVDSVERKKEELNQTKQEHHKVLDKIELEWQKVSGEIEEQHSKLVGGKRELEHLKQRIEEEREHLSSIIKEQQERFSASFKDLGPLEQIQEDMDKKIVFRNTN